MVLAYVFVPLGFKSLVQAIERMGLRRNIVKFAFGLLKITTIMLLLVVLAVGGR
jgi:hypothetical protein